LVKGQKWWSIVEGDIFYCDIYSYAHINLGVGSAAVT